MARIIVNAPSGLQEIIDVGIGGEYFDETLVVWDERKDGAIPEGMKLEAGKMAKEGGNLIVLSEPLYQTPAIPNEEPEMSLYQLIALLKDKKII